METFCLPGCALCVARLMSPAHLHVRPVHKGRVFFELVPLLRVLKLESKKKSKPFWASNLKKTTSPHLMATSSKARRSSLPHLWRVHVWYVLGEGPRPRLTESLRFSTLIKPSYMDPNCIFESEDKSTMSSLKHMKSFWRRAESVNVKRCDPCPRAG